MRAVTETLAPDAQAPDPIWAQLAYLEDLLREWMTGDPPYQRLAPSPRANSTRETLPPPSRTTTVAVPQRAGGDYVSQLAAKLGRRSA